MHERDASFLKKLRARIDNWAKKQPKAVGAAIGLVLLAPDLFLLLARLAVDPEVPAGYKVKLVAVIAYFVSPFDLIPEAFVGPIGYADDVVLIALTLNDLLNQIDQSIVLKHWEGDGDLLKVVQHVLRIAESVVGFGILKKLRGKV